MPDLEMNRPRKMDEENAAYLQGVASILAQQAQQFKQTGSSGDDMLAENVWESIDTCMASAASDKKCSPIIESLLGVSNNEQIKRFLHGCKGYFVFLFTNRFSSHVLQKVLDWIPGLVDRELKDIKRARKGERPAKIEKDEDADDEEKDDEHLSFASVIYDMCKEISDDQTTRWVFLISDMCATHVVRSLLHLLSGIEVEPEAFGLKAKMLKAAERNSSAPRHPVPPSFLLALGDIAEDFAGSGDSASIENPNPNDYYEKVRDLAYDSNASACLQEALTCFDLSNTRIWFEEEEGDAADNMAEEDGCGFGHDYGDGFEADKAYSSLLQLFRSEKSRLVEACGIKRDNNFQGDLVYEIVGNLNNRCRQFMCMSVWVSCVCASAMCMRNTAYCHSYNAM
jgi:hypothetical protein